MGRGNDAVNVGGIAPDRLRSFVERIERVNTEIKDLNDDKREIYGEARGNGFDVKIMKECIKLRAQEVADRREHDELIDLYMRALDAPRAAVRESPAQTRDRKFLAGAEWTPEQRERLNKPHSEGGSDVARTDSQLPTALAPVMAPVAASAEQDTRFLET